jgi:ABC-type amino acid transport substrate-binding protein
MIVPITRDKLIINSVDDLSGKTVHTRASSVYHEDLVKMLNLGLFEVILVDDLVAKESQFNQDASIFFAASAHCRRGAGALR